MYLIDIILIYPSEYNEKFDTLIHAVESATNHYVAYENYDKQSEIKIHPFAVSRIDKIYSSLTPVEIKRNLITLFANLKLYNIQISIKSKKVRFWEEHSKAIAFFLGLTSLAGLIVGISAWTWHDSISDFLKYFQ